MIFLDSPRFPPCVALSAQMGPTYKTYVSETAAGVETRDEQWSAARQRFTFAHVPMNQEQHNELVAFFESRAGRAGAFRVRHPGDYALTAANSQLMPLLAGFAVGTAGFGYGIPIYQIRRLKTYGSLAVTRPIIKPVPGNIFAVRNGVQVAFGLGAGQCAIDTATGLVTFVADQTQSISSHTVGGQHILTLAGAFSPNLLSTTGRVYVTGVTGTAADVLNDMSHECVIVAGAVITTNTNTTGLTASGGSAFFYPQPTETLTASGEFDYPCRFTSDEATFEIVDKNLTQGLLWQWTGIDLIEVKGE